MKKNILKIEGMIFFEFCKEGKQKNVYIDMWNHVWIKHEIQMNEMLAAMHCLNVILVLPKLRMFEISSHPSHPKSVPR